RFLLPVSTLGTRALASTRIAEGSCSSNTIVPCVSWKTPWTLEKKWRTSKPTSLWLGSTFHVVGAASAAGAASATVSNTAKEWWVCFISGNLLEQGRGETFK